MADKEDRMYTFLRQRGVDEETIRKMKEEKIDSDVVENLDPDNKTLADCLCFGDRAALVRYCKNTSTTKESAKETRKRKCYQNIRQKLQLALSDQPSNDTDIEVASSKSVKLSGNKNASKKTKKIEFGWVHNGVGVRKQNGGGTRTTTVAKSANANDLLDEGKALYFPGGVSRKGLDLFLCTSNIADFSHSIMSSEHTVGGICDSVRMSGTLRFYLETLGPPMPTCCSNNMTPGDARLESTTTCMPYETNTGNDQENHNEDFNMPRNSSFQGSTTDMVSSMNEAVVQGSVFDTSRTAGSSLSVPATFTSSFGPRNVHGGTMEDHTAPQETMLDTSETVKVESASFVPSVLANASSGTSPGELLVVIPSEVQEHMVIHKASECDSIETCHGYTTANNGTIYVVDSVSRQDTQLAAASSVSRNDTVLMVAPVAQLSPTTPPATQSSDIQIPVTLTLHRVMIQQEIVAMFKAPDIINRHLNFKFVDESGVDADGVSREAYSSFWTEMYMTSMIGEREKIPMLFPEYGAEEWAAVGRILAKGFVEQGVFPDQLAEAFAVALINGEEAVTPEVLMTSFMEYISETDKQAVEKALAGELTDEDDREDLLDLLSRVDCRAIPSDAELKPTLLHIAHKEMIQASKYALDCMASAARPILQSHLPDALATVSMLGNKTPTTRKVLKLLQSVPQNQEEDKAFTYLKQFVKGLDSKTLRKFLRYVTGAEVLCVEKVDVQYNMVRKGLGRSPIAHTCGPVLELPATYGSYNELRTELLNILESGYLAMDII